jgi:hypothetical protein
MIILLVIWGISIFLVVMLPKDGRSHSRKLNLAKNNWAPLTEDFSGPHKVYSSGQVIFEHTLHHIVPVLFFLWIGCRAYCKEIEPRVSCLIVEVFHEEASSMRKNETCLVGA